MKGFPVLTTSGATVSSLMGLVSRVAYVLAGSLTIAIGVAMGSFMTVAMISELLANDFFGVAVSALVVVFGIQIAKIGIHIVRGARLLGAGRRQTAGFRRSTLALDRADSVI